MDQKEDFIGKRVNDTKKLFGMAREDAMALMLVLSIIGNIWLAALWQRSQKDLIESKDQLVQLTLNMSERINEEIRRQMRPAITQEVAEQVKPIKDGVDTVKTKAEQVFDKILN